MASVLHASMLSIRAKILALALPDILPDNVLILKRLRDRDSDLPVNPTYPCILIGPVGSETLDPNGGTNLRDDIVYPINIAMLDLDNQDQDANFDRNLFWREQIRQKLNNKRLDDVPSVIRVTVQPGVIVDPKMFDADKYCSILGVNVRSREERIA